MVGGMVDDWSLHTTSACAGGSAAFVDLILAVHGEPPAVGGFE